MQRFLIKCANGILLAIIFIGIPAITHARLGGWEISSAHQAQRLMLWGLGIAAAGNALAAMFLIKGGKERKLCWEWAAAFAGLLGVLSACLRGYFNFDWLKQALQWLQKRL
jgi:hypothetical protein